MTPKLTELLKQLAPIVPSSHQHVWEEMKQEVEQLLNHCNDEINQDSNKNLTILDDKSGCYRQGNNATHYCPKCYDSQQQLQATQRINRQLRVCPHCRSSIKPLIKK